MTLLRAFHILLFVTTFLSGVAYAQVACVDVLRPANEPWTMNDVNHYQPVTLSNGIPLSPEFQHHILHGDFKSIPTYDGDQTVLIGGMHTIKALNFFFEQRPDFKKYFLVSGRSVKRFPNGVEVYSFPGSAFAANVRRGLKTIFPRVWSNEKIFKSIEYVLKNGKLFSEDAFEDTGRARIAAFYEGVRVVVEVSRGKHPRLITAYPSQFQTEADASAPTRRSTNW